MSSFIPKIIFLELVNLVGFIMRIYHDARSSERKKKIKSSASDSVLVRYVIALCVNMSQDKWLSTADL
jgi:hypothetical protein